MSSNANLNSERPSQKLSRALSRNLGSTGAKSSPGSFGDDRGAARQDREAYCLAEEKPEGFHRALRRGEAEVGSDDLLPKAVVGPQPVMEWPLRQPTDMLLDPRTGSSIISQFLAIC